ncbi:tetratricopeptide repeat protein 16 isoform X2 [Pungitius pungitius]|uniref:tetratricopeptide repeat protein 16 isoform X2 n=1 Tax=Pungitius pungitius TaxID=134920 RepID=UPI002E0E45E6
MVTTRFIRQRSSSQTSAKRRLAISELKSFNSYLSHTMEASVDTKEQTTEELRLFPTAEAEDERDEARRRSPLRRLFCSSKIFLPPGGERPQRPELQMSVIIQSKAAQHYTNGKELMGKCQFEKALICFSRGVTLQPEQTHLHEGRAEAYLQMCDFQSAAACYKRAWMLQPGACRDRLAFVYYLQGQCLLDRGLFLEALEAFSKAAEVKPGCRSYEVKSLVCLAAAGHHADCLKQVNQWMLSDGPTSDLYILRARLLKLLNKTSQCFRDVTSALALNPRCPVAAALLQRLREAAEENRRQAADAVLSGRLPDALLCIDHALEHCPRDARLYLFRGTLYRRMKDFTAAIEDLVQAMELLEEEEEVRGQTDGRGSVEEEVRRQTDGLGPVEEVRGQTDGRGSVEVRGQMDGRGSVEEEVRRQTDGRGSMEEEVRRQTDGRGSMEEEVRRQTDGRGSVEEEVRRQTDGRGSVEEEEVRGQTDGRGSVEEEVRFQLVLTYNDLAVQCFGRGLHAEATVLLNKAVEEEKGEAGLYLNRGDCFFQQGEWRFALADYQQAEEMMRPDDPAVRLRLAVLHNTLGSLCFQDGCFQEAVDMFSAAVRYDPTAGRYYESRSKAFRKLLDLEGARRDLICTLILDPTNEELPPMLMDLFPGCSAADVLSGPAGQAVRADLMDAIQPRSSSSDQQRLKEDLQRTTLTNENPSEAGKEREEVQTTVNNLLWALRGDDALHDKLKKY